MEKKLLISNLKPDTTIQEVRTEIGGPIPIVSIAQLTDKFANQVYKYPFFVIETTQSGVQTALRDDNIFRIRGNLLKFELINKIRTDSYAAVLYGPSKQVSRADVFGEFENYNACDVNIVECSIGSVYVVMFDSQKALDYALVMKPCSVIESSMFYLKNFPKFETEVFQIPSKMNISPNEYPRTLTIINNDKKYVVPMMSISALSSVVRENLIKDPAFSELTIDNIDGSYQLLVNYLYGKQINLEDDPVFLFQISIALGMKKLEQATEELYYDTLTLQNIVSRTKLAIYYESGMNTHIKFIRSHYKQLENDQNFKSIENTVLAIYQKMAEQKEFQSLKQYEEVIQNSAIDLNEQRSKIMKVLSSIVT